MFSLKFSELMPEGVVLEFDSFYKRLNRFLQESFNDDGTLITPAPAQVSDLGLPVGTVIVYAASTVPTGWLLCDGTAISRATYSTLFDSIGTTYGTGNGSTTFNIPNLRQRFPLGKASSGTGSTLGSTGGAIDHTHTGPSHTHPGPAHTHGGVTGAEGTGATGAPSATTVVQSGVGATVASATHTHTGPSHTHTISSDGTGDTGSGGAGTTGTSNPPYQVLNYLILYA